MAKKHKLHVLKCFSEYFQLIVEGKKNFEVRYNDRDYKDGDFLMLYETEEDTKNLTRKFTYVKITYILVGFEGLKEGWVCMSIRPVTKEEEHYIENPQNDA